MTFLVCLGALTLGVAIPANAGTRADKHGPGQAAEPDYRGTLRALAQSACGRLFVVDESLERVARWLAAEAISAPADRGAVRERLWREGIIDFEFSPVSLVVPKGSLNAARTALKQVLEDSSVPWARYNTLAVAAIPSTDTVGIGLVFVRRVARVRGGGLRGKTTKSMTISLGAEYDEPELFITAPQGTIVRRKADRYGDNSWRADARPIGGAGVSLWELLARGPKGPEVLALWRRETLQDPSGRAHLPSRPTKQGASSPLAHNPYLRSSSPQSKTNESVKGTGALAGSDAAAWVVGARSGPDRAPKPADVALAEELLWSLIQETRRSRGLVELRRAPSLTRAARRHAADLRRGERFGHETSSGNALSRIEAQGVTALRATENVAMAANVVEAHAALMASPAHRANILDPEVSEGAVGVVLKRDSRGRWSAVVSEVFAQLLAQGPGNQWVAAILNRINGRRKALDLVQLTARDKLDKLALQTSQRVVQSGTSTLSKPERKEIAAEARFHYLNVRRVGVDLLVTADPNGVDRVAHALEPSFRELGIGIVRLEEPMGDHARGALVITLVFIER